ncbi:MAG: helix-turn-helix domain-containing protein, partial [Acidimicrobiales bacterium]
MSPQDAAFLLGVSRPMVVRWIREGLLEDRKTGAHHKIPLTSVHALREQRAAAGRDAVAAVRDAKVDASAKRRTASARARAQARLARRDRTTRAVPDEGPNEVEAPPRTPPHHPPPTP